MTNTKFYEVKRLVINMKGRSVKTKLFASFEEALKYARRYTRTTATVLHVHTEIFENNYKLDFEPSIEEAVIYIPENKNLVFEIKADENFTNGKIEKDYREEEIEEQKKETEKQYLVKSENGFELTTNDLQEAKKTIYNETCRNINDTFAIIELNPDGSWKKVLIECKLTNREQANKLADFVANNVKKQRQRRQI